MSTSFLFRDTLINAINYSVSQRDCVGLWGKSESSSDVFLTLINPELTKPKRSLSNTHVILPLVVKYKQEDKINDKQLLAA